MILLSKRKLERKRALKSTRRIGKVLHKVFKTVVKEILQELTPLGESSSEVYHFIPEPINFSGVTKLSDDIKKHWRKKTLKEIKTLTNNHNFIANDPKKDEPVNQCMDV